MVTDAVDVERQVQSAKDHDRGQVYCDGCRPEARRTTRKESAAVFSVNRRRNACSAILYGGARRVGSLVFPRALNILSF